MEGMEKFTRLVKGMAPGDIPCQICVRAVNKKPGLKEANFQVGMVICELDCLLRTLSTYTLLYCFRSHFAILGID